MSDPFSPQFFHNLQQLKIHTRRAFLGSRQGSHISVRRGHGLEFADYRPYTSGDDFRYIDWSVYGRTDRVYVKQFREEQDLNVAIMLDCSHSMAFPETSNKFTLARDLALALGYIALTDGDTVIFSALGQTTTPRYSHPKSFAKARLALSKVEPEHAINLEQEIRAAVSRLKIPGKCFLISDFLIEQKQIFTSLDFLRARNFDIVLIQVLAPEELSLKLDSNAVVEDAETGEIVELGLDGSSGKEYAHLLADHLEKIEQYCFRAGITHLLVPSNETVAEIVLKRLPLSGVLK